MGKRLIVSTLVLGLALIAVWVLLDDVDGLDVAGEVARDDASSFPSGGTDLAPPSDDIAPNAAAVSLLLKEVPGEADEPVGPFPGLWGLVVDEARQPLADAAITVRRIAKSEQGIDPESLDPIGSATTDEFGRYRWEDEGDRFAGETVLLTVTAPGHGRATLLLTVPGGETKVETFVLPKAGSLRFQLLAADGKPGIGVDASIWPLDTMSAMRWNLAWKAGDAIPDPAHTAVTDNEGKVALPSDIEHPALVLFGREDRAILPLVVVEAPEDVTVVDWSPAEAVTGTVVDDAGEPVPGADVVMGHSLPEIPSADLAYQERGRRPVPGGWLGESTRSDAEGRFAFGTRSLYVSTLQATKLRHRNGGERLHGDRGPVIVTLERSRTILVELLDRSTEVRVDGTLVARASDAFGREPADGKAPVGVRIRRAEVGLFELEIDRSYQVDVIAAAPGYTDNRATVNYEAALKRKEITGKDFRIRMWPGDGLVGVATDGLGRPVEGVTVDLVESPRQGMHATTPPGPPVATMVTAADGHYAFRDLPEGRFRLNAAHPQFAPHETASFSLAGRGRTVDQNVRLSAPGALVVEVEDVFGFPVEGAWVGTIPRIQEVEMPTGFGWVDGHTDVEGRVRFSDLEPGPRLVMARLPNEDERDMRLLHGAKGMLLISARESGPEADQSVDVVADTAVPVFLVLGVRPAMGCHLTGRLIGMDADAVDEHRVRWKWLGSDARDAGEGPYAGRPLMGELQPAEVDVSPDGSFDFGVVLSGWALIEVKHGETLLATPWATRQVDLPHATRHHLDIDLPYPRRVRLRVLAPETGAPLTAGEVAWIDGSSPPVTGSATLTGGAHDLDLATGRWTFAIRAEGWGQDPRPIEIPKGVGVHLVDLEAERAIEWDAVLVDRRDRPLSGVRVHPYERDGVGWRISPPSVITDDSGRAVFSTLPPGRYRARIYQSNPMGRRGESEFELDLTGPSGGRIVVPDPR